MTTPLVGITTYERNAKHDFALPAPYIEAVRRAGGIPVLLPPGDPAQSDLLNQLDAIILSGGMDLDINLYGGSAHPQVEPPDPERDESEIQLIHRVVATRIPTLCICRGLQVLNVALGGTLIEHLPDVVGEQVPHATPTGDPVPHRVSVSSGSRLQHMVEQLELEPASWHHQAIRQVATGLEVVARSDDGTIEAVEMPTHPWLIGVQWHPELTAATDPSQQRLFAHLVQAALA